MPKEVKVAEGDWIAELVAKSSGLASVHCRPEDDASPAAQAQSSRPQTAPAPVLKKN